MNYSSSELLECCRRVSRKINENISSLEDLKRIGTRQGQYFLDIIADNVGLEIFDEYNIGVLSEESGVTKSDSDYVAILDPVDGSTNASNKIPLFCTSILILFKNIPVFGFIAGHRFDFELHGSKDLGVYLNGDKVDDLPQNQLSETVVSFSGYPMEWGGWKQSRSLGSAALEIAFVATGSLGAYFDASLDGLAIWDYGAGIFIAGLLGCSVKELMGRDLNVYDFNCRRHPIVGTDSEITDDLINRLQKTRAVQRDAEILRLLKTRIKVTQNDTELKTAWKICDAIESGEQIFSAEDSNLHLTGSAIIVSDKGILLHEHLKLKKWVQPGGHLDFLETPYDAAKREALEETGLEMIDLTPDPILLNVAEVAGPDGHCHLDMRFLFSTAGGQPSPAIGESQKVEWFSYDKALTTIDNSNKDALIAAKHYLEANLQNIMLKAL